MRLRNREVSPAGRLRGASSPHQNQAANSPAREGSCGMKTPKSATPSKSTAALTVVSPNTRGRPLAATRSQSLGSLSPILENRRGAWAGVKSGNKNSPKRGKEITTPTKQTKSGTTANEEFCLTPKKRDAVVPITGAQSLSTPRRDHARRILSPVFFSGQRNVVRDIVSRPFPLPIPVIKRIIHHLAFYLEPTTEKDPTKYKSNITDLAFLSRSWRQAVYMELCGDLNFIINQFDRFSRFVDTLENSTFLFSPRGNSPTSLLVRSPASCLSFNTFIRAITLSSGKEWPKMDASHLILVIATTCPAIERLEIVRCNELSIAALAALASGCPKLRALSIVGSSSPYGDLRAKPLHINTFPEDETELSMKCSTDASVPEKHRVPFLKNSCTIEDHQLVLRRLTSFRLSLIRWNYLESALQSVGNLQYLDLSRPFDSKDDNDQDSQALRAAIEKSPALRGLWLSTLGPGIMPPKSMNAQTHSLLSPSDLCLATPTRTGFAQVPQILDESISLFDVIRQSCRQLEVLSIRPRRYCGISNGLIRFLSNEVAAANLVKLAIQTDLLGAEGLIQLALHANKLDHLLLDGSWDQIIHTKSSSYGRLRGGMLDSSASRKKPKSDPTVRAAGIPRNYSNRGQSLSQQVALSNMAARMKLIPPSKSAATCSEPTHVNALAAEPSIRKLLPKAQAHHSLSMAPLQRHISPPGSRSTRGKVTKEAAMEPQKKLIDSLERLIEMRGKQLKTLSLYGWAELITETRVQVLAVLLPNLINLDLRSTAAARTVDVRADEAGVRSPKVRAGADDVGVRTRLQLRKQMQGGVSNTGSGRSGQKAESAWDTGEHGGSSSKRGSPLRSVTSAPIPPRVSPAKRSHPENSFWSSLATSCTRLRSVSLYEDATNKVREAKSSESRPDFDGDDFEDRVFKGDWGRLE